MKKKGEMLSSVEMEIFFESMALLIKAGIIVDEIPGIIAGDMDEGNLKTVCQNLDELLQSGEQEVLSDAMKKIGVFPIFCVKIFQIGETSGRLEASCGLLRQFFRRQTIVDANIRGAIVGPLFLLGIMSVVLFLLIVYILPVFQQVFNSLGAEENNAMGIAIVASKVILFIVCFLLVFLVINIMLYQMKATRNVALKILLFIRPIRNIGYFLSASRFTKGLHMLIASGIDSATALEYVSPMVSDKSIAKKLPECQKKVDNGEDLGVALVESGALVGFEAKILLSASRSGKTEQAMDRLSGYYDEKANAEIDTLLSMVEPILVGVLSLSVGIILISVMLPLISIMGAL